MFNSIEEIAHYYQIHSSDLKSTIAFFNKNCSKGKDSEFEKPILKNAKPIEKAPYYTMRLWPKVHFCMGGLKINTKAEVLGTKKTPIRGLYAAGEVTGGVHGASRLGSCSITDCIVFGRIAGHNAAKHT